MYKLFLSLLDKKKVTAYRVAKEIGIHPTVFTDWKKGKSAPKVNKLKKIANYFGVSVDYFLEEQEPSTAKEETKL